MVAARAAGVERAWDRRGPRLAGVGLAGGGGRRGGAGKGGGSGAARAGENEGPRDTSVAAEAADANRRECSGANECPQPTGECAYATCVEGGCGKAFHPAGTACSFGGGNICDGTGSCVECVQPSDCGTPSNSPCVIATCSVDHHCGTANAPPTTNCGDAPFC